MKKDSTTKTISRYATSKMYNSLLGTLSAYVRPKLLSPELFGLLNLLSLIPTYSSYAHFGARDSVRYIIPSNEAKGEFQKNRLIEGSTFYGTMVLNLMIAIPLIFYSLLSDLLPEVRYGLLSMALVVILNGYCEYYLAILKSYQQFHIISSSNYLRSTSSLASGILFIYLFGIFGAYISAIFIYIVLLLYFRTKYPLKSYKEFDFSILKELIQNGFPIMIFSLIVIFMMTSGRIIVSYFLGVKHLGYYGIATLILTALMQLPGTAREVIEPKLMQSLHLNSSYENYEKYFLKPLIHTAYYMPFFIGTVILVLPLIIPLILPKYIPCIFPTQILIFGAYFLSLSFILRGIIVANKLQLQASFVSAFSLIINIGLCVFLVKIGLGLEGVALGSSISFFLLFTSLLIFIRGKYHLLRVHWKLIISAISIPFPVMFSIIVLMVGMQNIVHLNKYLICFFELSIFFSIMIAVIHYANNKYAILSKFELRELI